MTLTRLGRGFPLDPGLVVSLAPEGAATVVTLRGEADLATQPLLAAMIARVMADHVGDVVVDLGPTTFIDTASARTLGQAGPRLLARGRRLTFRSPSRMAVKVLNLLGYSDLIEHGPPPAAEPGRR